MAISTAAATTGAAAGSNIVTTYFQRKLIERVKQNARFYQFGQKTPLPKGEGNSVYWNRKRALDLGYILSEGTPTSAPYALCTTRISAKVEQMGGLTTYSDLLDLTALTDVGRYAADELADQAARTVDRYIYRQIGTNHDTQTAGDSVCHFIKTSTEVSEYWGEISAASATVFTASSANVIAVSDLRKISFNLKRKGADTYDGKNYVAIMNTETCEDVAGDDTWINWHQYPANEVEALYSGEIGRVYGVRVVEDNFGPVLRGSNAGGTASSLAYGTLVMGKGFFGITEIDGGVKLNTVQGADKADPLNQVTVMGWKVNLAAQVLNPSCGAWLWTGSGDTTTAYAESAGSGLRHEAPTSY